MRKHIWWIIGGISLVAGAALLIIATCLGARGVFFNEHGKLGVVGTDIITIEETVISGFQSIDVDIDLGEIELRPSKDGTYGYRIEYGDRFAVTNSAEVIDGTLFISNKQRNNAWNFEITSPWNSAQTYNVVITYPANVKFDYVEIENNLGTIKLGDFETDSLNVTANLGDVKATHIVSYDTAQDGISFFTTSSIPVWAHPTSYSMGTGSPFPGTKRQGREADHSPLTTRLKTRGAIPSLHQYVIIAWCSIE